jgi:hypothetical protein
MTRDYLAATAAIAGAAVLAACGGKTAPAGGVGNLASPEPPPRAAAATDRTIRGVDFQNFTYALGDSAFTVTAGECVVVFDADDAMMTPDEFVRRYPGAASTREGFFHAALPAYGDVDGDGADDAVILTTFNGGGSGQLTSAWVYHLVGGAPAVLGVVPGGDRADHGLNAVSIDAAGRVVVERNLGGDGACCPTATQLERWRWDGRDFVEDEAARGPIKPFED